MIPLFEKTNPIQAGELPGYQPALESTQGNILKSHGRKLTLTLFLTFTGDKATIRAAIRTIAPNLTSAWVQAQQTRNFKDNGTESLFASFGLSADGYRYLGKDVSAFSPAFVGGMARPNSGIGDQPSFTWEAKFQTSLHATILLAHNDPAALDAAAAAFRAPFQGWADIISESGAAIITGNEPVEQFGFVDGVSQPLFFQSDVDAEPGPFDWDPSAGTNLVLVKDPGGSSGDDCGSYLVFRKLRQDVAGFKKREADLHRKLFPGQHPELGGALVVGRFKDGTPVAIHSSPQASPNPENNFLFVGGTSNVDPYEKRCPVSAHIRKVNPRGDTNDLASERTHRIARRGITYGIQDRDAEVGLLFQCCQSSLENQFEFLQGKWINQPRLPSTNAGVDPIAGESTGSNQVWPLIWSTHMKMTLDFGGFITLRGGGYFFLPSIPFLKQV